MSKEKVEYLVDYFTDENGNIRNFVIAALTVPITGYTAFTEKPEIENPYYECEDDIVKGVKLGWAICNPTDIFYEELGKKIALGRAKKNLDYCIYATKPGYINTKMVKAFLEQEADYFKTNPEYRIAGYKRKK